MARATFAVGLVKLATQDMNEAERLFHTARALAGTVGAHRLQLDSENNLGEVFRHRGEIRNAERMYEGVARMADEKAWPECAAITHLNLAIISHGREEENFARIAIDEAEKCLTDLPQHWAWMFIGVVRAAWAAELGDEPTCRAWWAVAQDRGLGRVLSPDLIAPLDRLAHATRIHNWNDLTSRALQYREAIQESSPTNS